MDAMYEIYEEPEIVEEEEPEHRDTSGGWYNFISDLELQSILSLRGVNPARYGSGEREVLVVTLCDTLI